MTFDSCSFNPCKNKEDCLPFGEHGYFKCSSVRRKTKSINFQDEFNYRNFFKTLIIYPILFCIYGYLLVKSVFFFIPKRIKSKLIGFFFIEKFFFVSK